MRCSFDRSVWPLLSTLAFGHPAAADDGIYGTWFTDAYNMPAFHYSFDELTDARALWFNTEGEERRDHFQLFGNHRVNAMAVDHGYVTLYGNDRAPTWMNHFQEDQLNLGGGFSYIKTPDEAFCTAHLFGPAELTIDRTFGMGYYEVETVYAGIRVNHRIFAPFGDDPLLIDEVDLENIGPLPLPVSHYEYWDVNRHQLATQWIRTGSQAATAGDRARDRLNGRFSQQVSIQGDLMVASMEVQRPDPPDPEAIAAIDAYPPDLFLALLVGEVQDFHGDQTAFFGDGTAEAPEAVVYGLPGGPLRETRAYGQPAMFAMRTDLVLDPGVVHRLRFAYGYLPEGKDLGMLEAYRDPDADLLEASLEKWRTRLVIFTPPEDVQARARAAAPASALPISAEPHAPPRTAVPPTASHTAPLRAAVPPIASHTVSVTAPLAALEREALWRSYQLQGSTVYSDYYEGQLTPQGSAYLYLSGGDGAPRDQALFAAPLVYLDPELARANLRLIARLQDAENGAITYSFTGHGVNESAVIHRAPSDLDLFFLMALTEYLAATGDREFLLETTPFHPKDATSRPPGAQGDTLLDHARAAFRHLMEQVQLGDHGLVRIGDGDWSDGVVYRNPYPQAILNTIKYGESVPNSQMALFVLPRIAAQLEPIDPTLSLEMQALAEQLEAPVRDTFGGLWFGRAWFRTSANRPFLEANDGGDTSSGDPNSYLDLEAQPWGLLSDLLTLEERERLLDEIERRLDDDSPIGPRLTEDGQVWPAISQLMTWAYARYRPDAAWRSLTEHLYSTHTDLWPETWMGTLSGPDGWISEGQERAGGTWYSAFTPMTDFPVANMNPDAMWLLGLVRTCGLEPTGDGLSIQPRRPGDTYTLDLPLLRLEVDPDGVTGVYRAHNTGEIRLRVAVPDGSSPMGSIDGLPIEATVIDGQVTLPLSFTAGQQIAFTVSW